MSKVFVIFIGALLLYSCKEATLPKQHAYPFIEFPTRDYQNWHMPGSPYSFDKPVYSSMLQDTSQPYWFNLVYEPFGATLFLSYHQFSNEQTLDTLIQDTRNLVYKHTIKASDIIDREIVDSNGRSGMFYELEGETATSCNFYLTDRKTNFFRGALYFDNYTTIDSVGPVVKFIKQDIQRMIKSFQFEK